MKKIILIFFISFALGQFIDKEDIAKMHIDMVLDLASRSEQRVFVDDFTGLL